ncbi:hypothetical protein [Anaeromicrobium sediminis]|uniref:UDP-N-acetyl-alpha-D-muramoyl-L-alanyl-L-glutamate epimerase n=1 Tax=Anaeromicrobium sediminis TaxID=1478221 RepID=A0A267ML12_9FIRM|nr:hypothetical protein [Anaeromicrobium sediminis]PAB59575.1 hypothetical protein CCE28_10210 [Anaeromicrobium sediminis]
MITVRVQWPEIKKDTVRFFWHTNKTVPLFRKNNFYFKYEGLNIEKMPIEVYWNAFLALMIPVFNICKEDVLFIFPHSIPSFMAETWINFHSASNITISPLSDKSSIELSTNHDNSTNVNSKVGVLFGGGKDSSCTFSILSEVHGIENILLISYVFGYDKYATNKIDKRRENMILNPLKKDLNVKIQKIVSDFQSTLKDQSAFYSPHTALFTGTVLPVIIKYNISLLTHSNEFVNYSTGIYNSNITRFNFRLSRPEYDNYLSARINSFFKTDVSIKNISYSLSDLASFKILAQRYPHILKHIMMCETIENPNIKWCKNCFKCAKYVFYSLYTGHEQHDIDIDYFFSKSSYIKDVLESTKNLQPTENGNYPFHPSIGYFETFYHMMASINPEDVKKRTSQKGYRNFMILKNRYGNKKFPVYDSFIEPAFKKLSLPFSKEIRKIITTHCPEIEKLPEYFLLEGIKVTIDYNLNCHVPKIFNVNHEKKLPR